MANAVVTRFAQKQVASEFEKRNGYIFSAPNKDERGRKLSKSDKIRWEIAHYSDPRWAIPEDDLKILMEVKRRAKQLDAGHRIGPLKFGQAAVLGLVPVIGDFADIILAYIRVYRKATKVSKGDDMLAFKSKMKIRIVALGAIGTVPMIGDFADTLLKFNTQNAASLERLLLRRSGYFEVMAKEKAAKKSRRHMNSSSPSNESLPPPSYDAHHFDHRRNPSPARQVLAKGMDQGKKMSHGRLPLRANRKPSDESHEGNPVMPARPRRPDPAQRLGSLAGGNRI